MTGTRWAFHKGHVPAELFECDVPLIVEPPKNLLSSQKTSHDRRSAWMLCAAIRHVNRLAAHRKKEKCGDGRYNTDHRLRILPGGRDGGCTRFELASGAAACWPFLELEKGQS